MKQQISIRTFQISNEIQPSFLEAERACPVRHGHRGSLRVHVFRLQT